MIRPNFLKYTVLYIIALIIFIFLLIIYSSSKNDPFLLPVSNRYIRDVFSKVSNGGYKNPISKRSEQRYSVDQEVVSKNIYNNDEEIFNMPILIYHYIDELNYDSDTLRRSLTTPPEIFEEQIRTLIKNGYKVYTLYDLVDVLNGEKEINKKSFILTFDDGYKDFYTQAFPVLELYNLKSTNFLILNSINLKGTLKNWQIEELYYSGLVDFGSHSVSHVNLQALSKTEMEKEVFDSKYQLEELLNIPIDFFSYPGGKYNSFTEELVNNAGYLAAVSTDLGIIQRKDSIFRLKRIKPGKMSGKALLAVIEKYTE